MWSKSEIRPRGKTSIMKKDIFANIRHCVASFVTVCIAEARLINQSEFWRFLMFPMLTAFVIVSGARGVGSQRAVEGPIILSMLSIESVLSGLLRLGL
ncbi:hypothetical protein F5X98DRAFT_359722 [Xylaria grammica]|nr:hypothetical protein F5X98DRAFT_359722 [Xylaria grammica]